MGVLIDALHKYNLRAFENIDPPELLPAQIYGSPGSTIYQYRASFKTLVGETTLSSILTVTNGPAVLSGLNKVLLQVKEIPAAVRYIRYWKKDGDTWKLLGEVEASVGSIEDQGQALQTASIPTENTSGRGDWQALLFHAGRYLQRMELTDLVGLVTKAFQGIGDVLHKNGDIIQGCNEQHISGNTWKFLSGKIYLDGHYIKVPEGQVTLTGTGTEVVGVKITPRIVTYLDDPVIRNLDEGISPATYNQPGADRLVLDIQWVINDPAAIEIRRFIDGQPQLKTFITEMTELDKRLARRTNDLAGAFVVKNFGVTIEEHPTDTNKLLVRVGPGKAYPEGYEIETIATQTLELPKARETANRNNETTDAFLIPGGMVLGTATEPFNLASKAIKLKVGNGNSHTVNFTQDNMTAAQVASAISTSVNAYPSGGSPALVVCEAVGGKVKIQAQTGKSLTLEAIANDAYTILGLSTGTYSPTGQRIYRLNNSYIKDVTDLSYICEVVEDVVHDGGTHKDLLSHSGVTQILGASSLAADCHDGKWNWEYGVDFGKSGDYIDFSLFGGGEPAAGTTYRVKYRYARNAIKGTRILVRAVDVPITKGVLNGIDNLTLTGASSIISVKTGNPVTGLSGPAKDVVKILRVNNSTGQSQTEYSNYTLVKNSTELAHNTSQISWTQGGTQPITGATYYVTFEFWHHATEGDFVVADSYDLYDQIETAPNGTWPLRDCLDFRTQTSNLPVPLDAPRFDYNYYLGRVDKIALRTDGYFELLQGVPAPIPVFPADQPTKLSTHLLYLSPYTYSTSDVSIRSMEAQRLTQRDLRELVWRLEKLEYYNAINNAEAETAAHSDAVDAKALFTDPVVGQARADLAFDKNGISYSASIDANEQCVKLPAIPLPKVLDIDLGNSAGIRRNGNYVVLDYEETVFQSQPKATKAINVNPDDVVEFRNGVLELDPEVDIFMDVEQMPASFINFEQNFDAFLQVSPQLANQITWGSWQVAGQAQLTAAQLAASSDEQVRDVLNQITKRRGTTAGLRWAEVSFLERTGQRTSIVPGRQTVDFGDRIVDLSLVPMMRTKMPDGSPFYINLTARAVYPNTDHACMIDNQVVNLLPTGTSQAGTTQYQGYSTVKSDNTGYFTARFAMPQGIPVGTKTIKIFSASNPDLSGAQAKFYSQGWRQTRQSTTVGFDTLQVRQDTITEKDVQWTGRYYDPLAQTFLNDTEELVYISGVRLYFQTKSEWCPITVEIAETLNGYPTRKVLASCTKQPNEVNVSTDGSVATTFIFPNIVGYRPNEYCIRILTNCTDYNIFVAELGGADLITGEPVLSQAHGGVLFHSPNASTWEPYTRMDLKFELLKANFENQCQIVFSKLTGIEAGMFASRLTDFVGPGANVKYSYRLSDTSPWIAYYPGIDTTLGQITDTIQFRIDVTSLGGSYQLIEKWAGILLFTHHLEGYHICPREHFPDELTRPSKVRIVLDLDTDGVNGSGVRSVTPLYTIDDEHWVEVKTDPAHTPSYVDNQYLRYEFVTPAEATISNASNATPVVITSTNHGFQNNQIVDITGVTGNTAANGRFRVKNRTADTFELYDPATDTPIAGNGDYVSGGTVKCAPHEYCRVGIKLTTSNKGLTPKVKNIRVIHV